MQTNHMKTLTYSPEEAERNGYKSITTLYFFNDEADMKYLSAVLADMANVKHCLIKTLRGVEVARLKTEIL